VLREGIYLLIMCVIINLLIREGARSVTVNCIKDQNDGKNWDVGEEEHGDLWEAWTRDRNVQLGQHIESIGRPIIPIKLVIILQSRIQW
jgi:hypothetical protein